MEFGVLLNSSQAALMKIVVQQDTTGKSCQRFMQGDRKQPKSIENWVSTYAIFSTVYASMFPGEGGSLMRYGKNVRHSCSLVAISIFMIQISGNSSNGFP